jgi:hypothetical protein
VLLWQSGEGRQVLRFLMSTTIAVAVVTPIGPVHNPFAFFHPTVAIGAPELDTLAGGAPLVRFLPASGTEVGAFTATAVAPHVTVDRVAAWMRQLELLRENRFVIATQRLSKPPRLSDFDRVRLDDEDLEAIRGCAPGHCDVKLSAADIEVLVNVAATGGRDWKPLVQQAFRERLLRRVLAFSAGGHAALDAIVDKKRPSFPARALSSLVEHTRFLGDRLPDVAARLGCPRAGDGESFMYWSNERLGGKPVITITHVQLSSGAEPGRPALLMIGTQIYASHYVDASLMVTAFVAADPAGPAYFVYMHRSSVDLLGGFWGGIARSIIEARVRKDGPAILRTVGERLASGDPPSTSARHGWPPR